MSVTRLRKLQWLASLCLAGLAPCIWAQSPNVLQTLYEAALRHDPQFRSAQHERDAGLQNKTLGQSAVLPQAQYSYNRSDNRADRSIFTNTGQVTTQDQLNYRSLYSGVSVRQPLYSREAWARYQQGQLQADYAQVQFEGREREVLVRLVEAYCNLWYAKDQIDLLEVQRQTLVEQLQSVTQQFDKGEASRTDLLEAQARSDLLEASRIEAEHALKLAQRTLLAMVGPEQRELVLLGTKPATFKFSPTALQKSLAAWETRVKERNADLRTQQLAVDIARQEYLKAQSGHLPRADLVASYAKSESENVNLVNQSYLTRSVGAQITIPLYAGGATEAGVSQAAASRARAEAELDNQTEKVMVELHKHYLTVGQVDSKRQALVKALVSANDLVEASRKSVLGGVRTTLDVLQAVQQVAQLQRDLLQAEYTGLISSYRLRWLAGDLSPEDLR
jgi:protease secretion system outer membrane protein